MKYQSVLSRRIKYDLFFDYYKSIMQNRWERDEHFIKRQILSNMHHHHHHHPFPTTNNLAFSISTDHISPSLESGPVFVLPSSQQINESNPFVISHNYSTHKSFPTLRTEQRMPSDPAQNRRGVRDLSNAFGSHGISGRVRSITLRSGRRSRGNLRDMGKLTLEDPLSIALRPPKNETEEERQIRIQNETNAKKRSDDIDKHLRDEANRTKDDRMAEKTILLLGQAEAGKTTIMKQMRMMYAPERQEQLRYAWTDVIYLNLVLAVKRLMEAQTLTNGKSSVKKKESLPNISSPVLASLSPGRATPPSNETFEDVKRDHAQNSKNLLLKLRFAPLLSMEDELRRKLGTLDESVIQQRKFPREVRRSSSFSHESLTLSTKLSSLVLKANWQEKMLSEGFLNEENEELMPRLSESSNRKSLASRFTPKGTGRTLSNASIENNYHANFKTEINQPMRKKMFCLLDASRKDITDLWKRLKKDDFVKNFSNDSTAYFLNNIDRFATSNFVPTDDDILRARVSTVGIFEERFQVNSQLAYRIVDVGGSQSQRNVWASFFINASAIIFLAPISAFDEMLSEDMEMNKVIDSLEIWKEIVSSPLLLKLSLILFLNKMDILEEKLAKGVQVKTHFKRYKGSNEFEDVWRYFRSLFVHISREHESKAPSRNLYVHRTTATSTTEIRTILQSCQDIILRQHLRDSAFT